MVQPLRTATECEVVQARERAGKTMGSDRGSAKTEKFDATRLTN